MAYIVDASVALKWFVDERGRAEALALADADPGLMAPDLVVAEVCNAAWRALTKSQIPARQYEEICTGIGVVFDRLLPLGGLSARAGEMARHLGHPVYDMFYVAAAEFEDARLVTADRRLLGVLQKSRWQALAVDLFDLKL